MGEIVEEDSKKGIKKLDSHKPSKSTDLKSAHKKPVIVEKKGLEDNKETRSKLREDYNQKLDRYRREHEQKLKLKKELQKKEKLQKKLGNNTDGGEFSQDDMNTGSENQVPKSPPSPPPPPQKRTRNDSGKSSASNHSQTISYSMPSPTGSIEQPCTPENIINEIEQADMFVEEQLKKKLTKVKGAMEKVKKKKKKKEKKKEKKKTKNKDKDKGDKKEKDGTTKEEKKKKKKKKDKK